MASYFGMTRSNYFAVKDNEKFLEEVKDLPIDIYTAEMQGETLYGFGDDQSDDSGNIYSKYNDDTEEYEEILWEDIFVRHLKDDWVATIIHVGYEKYRYFDSHATSFNNKGETAALSLGDILEMSKELGKYITTPEY